jgi:hypothetical protein
MTDNVLVMTGRPDDKRMKKYEWFIIPELYTLYRNIGSETTF